MRILLVTDWNRGRGGAEAYALWLRAGLRAKGDDARLLTSSAGSAADGDADYVAFGTERVGAQTLLQITNPLAAVTVRRAIREFRPDVACVNMFAHHLSPAVFEALGTTPCVLLVSDYKCVCPVGSKLLPDGSLCRVKAGWICCNAGCLSLPHWLRDQLRYRFIDSAVRGVDRILACSAWVQRELAQAGIASEIIRWPVAAPAPGFSRHPATFPLLVYVGRLDREKGVALLLRAFANLVTEIPATRLRLIGQGPERANLEQLASTLRIAGSVDFLGWKSAAEVELHLSDAWALVAPSLWAEPLGLVAAEALVRGVPVIASAAGGLGDIVDDQINGLLFANNDEAALADCLRSIAGRTTFPEHILPEAAIERVRTNFDMDRHIETMRRIFGDVAAGRV